MAKKEEKKAPATEKEAEKPAIPSVQGPKWIKVTAEQLDKLQKENRLAGYRPDTSEALIN